MPLTLTLPSSGLVREWVEATQTCRNMLGGLHLRLLSADVSVTVVTVV